MWIYDVIECKWCVCRSAPLYDFICVVTHTFSRTLTPYLSPTHTYAHERRPLWRHFGCVPYLWAKRMQGRKTPLWRWSWQIVAVSVWWGRFDTACEFMHITLFFSHFNPSPETGRKTSPLGEQNDFVFHTVHETQNDTYVTCIVQLVAVLSPTVMQCNSLIKALCSMTDTLL